MALVNPETSIIFVYISFFYNSLLAIKLIYDTFAGKVEKNKIAWNLISAFLILAGSILMFIWFPRAFTPVIGWDCFIGIILLFVNNLAATILAFMNRIEASRIAKAGNVIFTLLALVTMMQYLHKISALTPFILPRELGWLTLIPSIGYAQFQAFFYGSIGYFYPTLIFIPIAVPIKFRRKVVKKKEKVVKNSSKAGSKSAVGKSTSDKKKPKRNVFYGKKTKHPALQGGNEKSFSLEESHSCGILQSAVIPPRNHMDRQLMENRPLVWNRIIRCDFGFIPANRNPPQSPDQA